jgi:hypothetical protein
VIRAKASLDHRRIRRLIWLVLTVFLLLGYSLQSVAGTAYYSNEVQNYATVSTPPVILQNGTAGTSTIYTNNTSAKASVEAPLSDFVDNDISDVDNSPDIGTHSNFENQKAKDGAHDTLTEGVLNLAFIVGDDLNLDANKDTPIKNHLENAGHTVTIKDDGDTSYDPTSFDAIVISESSFSSSTGWLKNELVGILTVEGVNNDEFELASSGGSGTQTDNDVKIVNATHYITQEYNVSDVVTIATLSTNRGHMSGWANDVTLLAHSNDTASEAWILAVEKGGILQGGVNTAAERRVFLGAQYFDNLNSNGKNFFDRALEWVSYTEGDANYNLDLEVQWTSADYTQTNEELCIKTETFSGSENIQVKVWNNTGSSWQWIMNLTASQWNNVSITSYLISSTFTVQFLGGTETGDTSQDSWNIDATLLHIWTDESTWLSGWDKRVKITIGHNDIDSDLSDFPVLVYLSNSSGRNNDDATFVFDEVGSNSKKIAVTKSDGTTQCYVEIEKWDNASEQAWLWVKVPSISSTTNTDLYLYYDSSQPDNTAYVGDKRSTTAQNVWNTNFKGVWHLDEDPSGTSPQMKDSTSNNHNGTSYGNMTSGDQIAGKIDGSLNFDGSDDYIQTSSNELKTLNNFTLSVWFKVDSTTAAQHILWEGPASQNGWGDGSSPNSHEMHLTICKFNANNTLNFFYGYEDPVGGWVPAVEINISFSDTMNWNHVVVVMTGAGTSPSAELFLNGVSQGTDTGTQTNRTAWDTNLRIGRPGADQRYFDGVIDEVRILETAKNASWIKASYESGRDDLLDFGASGISEGTYDYVLRVNNTVTDSWQIRLKKYADSNISRLQNCTIYFHNSTDGTSNQIIIENGFYIKQTGPWYDLGDSETIYIAMTVQANSAATSCVYAYLEIRTPNTTTYAQYVITFEIT